jgi:hypothetical protein
MSEPSIKLAFEQALAAISVGLPTVYQGRDAPPGFIATQAHQKAFLLPAENETLGLLEKTTRHKGIFQVNLCYPSGTRGTTEADQRAKALQDAFYAGRELVADGVKVRVRGKPNIAAPVALDPYTVPVSIRYESIN